jgi:hypothetical protein
MGEWLSRSYEWQPAIIADSNFWPVRIDKDAGMAGRTAASIAHDHPVVSPPDWLFMNKVHCRVRLWLAFRQTD